MLTAENMDNGQKLLDDLRALAPWHHDIILNNNGLKTGDGNSATYREGRKENVSLVDVTAFKKFLSRLYPSGLKGKTVLDVACNGGGHSLAAHQLDADYVFGFDAREHWYQQCLFIKKYFQIPDERLKFEKCDLNEMLLKTPDFDITFFNGILYHIPDPITILLRLGEQTRKLILVDTAFQNDIPSNCLVPKIEGTEEVMSGINGLSWLPGGPDVLKIIMRQVGFNYSQIIYHINNTNPTDTRKHKGKSDKLGRLRMVFTREESDLPKIKPIIKETWNS